MNPGNGTCAASWRIAWVALGTLSTSPALLSQFHTEALVATIELGRYLHGRSTAYHDCIEACVECLVACEMCSDACLAEKDPAMLADCIRLDRDCAEACAAAIRVMARGGPQAEALCRACADACDACAAECEKHASHHEHCRLCAEACRKCAAACRQMLGK